VKPLLDVGVLGTGLWEGAPVTNDAFPRPSLEGRRAKDPYQGRRGDDGTVRIAGMALGPEEFPRTLAAIEEAFRDPYRGTVRRRFFPRELPVSEAEADAARAALADAGLDATDVDALLVQSFLPDELQPKNTAKVAHALGIRDAMAFGVDTICNSVISQLHVGASLIVSGQAQRVLCVVSCAYSRVSDPGASSSIQEADMAGAFVLGRRAGARLDFGWRADGRLHGAIKLAWDDVTGAAPPRWWEPSARRLLIRFDPALQKRVMGEIADRARVVCREALARAEMTIDEVELLVSHQPMAWYGAFLSDVLGLRDGVYFDAFEEYACINSAGIAASLHEARLAGRLEPGTRALIFSPAAGYVFGAAAVRW
jgi:3-oxoacyl-[acyl-carrier-protein] synthase-3